MKARKFPRFGDDRTPRVKGTVALTRSDPAPPVGVRPGSESAALTPMAMGKSTRGVELESVDNLDERQIAEWMKQVAAVPGVGGKKR